MSYPLCNKKGYSCTTLENIIEWAINLASQQPRRLVRRPRRASERIPTPAPVQDSLIRRILGGESIKYLERFRLDYSEIQLSFQEIRLVTQEGNHRLVITEGREHTYQWSRSYWETTLENPDHRLVNPEVHHFPPASLEELSLSRFSSEGATTQEQVDERLLDIPVPGHAGFFH